MRISSPCVTCGHYTEVIELGSLRFFCNTVCYDGQPVIRSTRDIRKTPRIRCENTNDEKCHILGLNAAKVIFNHYALEECDRIDDETLRALVIAINAKENLECCSAQKNVKDKETEEAFLDVFIYKKRDYESLDNDGRRMYNALKAVFMRVQEILDDRPSLVVDKILDDFALKSVQIEDHASQIRSTLGFLGIQDHLAKTMDL